MHRGLGIRSYRGYTGYSGMIWGSTGTVPQESRAKCKRTWKMKWKPPFERFRVQGLVSQPHGLWTFQQLRVEPYDGYLETFQLFTCFQVVPCKRVARRCMDSCVICALKWRVFPRSDAPARAQADLMLGDLQVMNAQAGICAGHSEMCRPTFFGSYARFANREDKIGKWKG